MVINLCTERHTAYNIVNEIYAFIYMIISHIDGATRCEFDLLIILVLRFSLRYVKLQIINPLFYIAIERQKRSL